MPSKPSLREVLLDMLDGKYDELLKLKSNRWQMPYLIASILSIGEIPEGDWPSAVDTLIETGKKWDDKDIHNAIAKAIQSLNGVDQLKDAINSEHSREVKKILQAILRIIESHQGDGK